MVMALKTLTYNAKGLNLIRKQWLALKEFKKSGAKNPGPGNTFPIWGLNFASNFFPTSFVASDTSGKTGVAILIRLSCPPL